MGKRIVLFLLTGIFLHLVLLIPGLSKAQQPACTCTCVDSAQECFDRNGVVHGSMTCSPSGVCCCTAAGDPLSFSFPNPLGVDVINDIAEEVINTIFQISLVLAPLMILWGAFLFITAAGNSEQAHRARQVVTWTLIGFLVILLAKGISSAIGSIFGL